MGLADQGAERGDTVSIERLAPAYDSSKRMSDEICIEVSREIFSEAGSREGMLVADIGVGTGRFSIPLMVRGCRVVGVDSSLEMIRLVLSRIRREWLFRLQPLVADAQNLPLKSKCLDAALCFQVLYLTQNWHLVISEAQRTLHDGAPLAVGESIRTGVSAEVNEKYKETRGRHGFPHKRSGASNIDEALKYFQASEWSVSETEALSWIGRMTINSIIQGLADKIHTLARNVPDEAHQGIIQELREWAYKRYNNLEISREVTSEFKLAFVRPAKP
jgi:ubiquinone/menaquinone biosynthesis C-methylase UbiE